jgi:deazaflavin-dependent oxidoreductase (nitroreductase family)
MAVIEHRGRRSGKLYRTPVMAFVESGRLSVVLNYGEGSDWVRNVVAAGSANVINAGKRYRLDNPRIMSSDSLELPEGVQALSGGRHRVLHGILQPA